MIDKDIVVENPLIETENDDEYPDYHNILCFICNRIIGRGWLRNYDLCLPCLKRMREELRNKWKQQMETKIIKAKGVI